MSHVILGIDPGFGKMGFGFIQAEGREFQAIDFGVIKTSGNDFGARLAMIAEDLYALFEEHKPEVMAIEKLFLDKNTKTAMQVAEARGIARLIAAQAGIPVIEYAPNQIKLALTGDGKANKSAMQRMVMQLLNLPRVPRPDDAADALAIAITASTKIRI